MPFFRSSDWHSHTNLWFHAEGFHMITLQPIPSSKDCNFLTNLLNLSPLKTRSDAFWEQWWFVGALFLKKKKKLKLAFGPFNPIRSIRFNLTHFSPLRSILSILSIQTIMLSQSILSIWSIRTIMLSLSLSLLLSCWIFMFFNISTLGYLGGVFKFPYTNHISPPYCFGLIFVWFNP